MSNLYFLEWMMIERMREVARPAELRSRLGLRAFRPAPSAGWLRRLLGTWLIRAGRRLQRGEPEPPAVSGAALAEAEGAGECGSR